MNSWATSNDPILNVKDDSNLEQYPILGQLPQQHQNSPQPTNALGQFLPPGLAPSSRLNTPIAGINNSVPHLGNNNSYKTALDGEDVTSDIDKFGLNGLLSTIRMENIEQTKFTIGTDLNMLGLNFLETDKLSTNFETPWPEIVRTEVEPSFVFDKRIQDIEMINLTEDKFPLLSDETLFFIFYTKPSHYLQELASKQLNNRNWRFHKDLQLWLTKDTNVEPIQQSNQSERGIYIFFDPSSWEKVKKEFVLQYLSLHQMI